MVCQVEDSLSFSFFSWARGVQNECLFTLIGYRYAPDLATFVPDSANLRVSSMRSDLILSVMAGVWMLQNELKARFGEGPDKLEWSSSMASLGSSRRSILYFRDTFVKSRKLNNPFWRTNKTVVLNRGISQPHPTANIFNCLTLCWHTPDIHRTPPKSNTKGDPIAKVA